MRFLLYNLRYGTGQRTRWAWMDMLRRTTDHLPKIAEFIQIQRPDVVGLVEVDTGSFRSGRRNQVTTLAKRLNFFHSHHVKYSNKLVYNMVPVLNKQGNAFLSRSRIFREHFYFFNDGVKRLVIELELKHISLFLVHLSLRYKIRHRQLSDLHDIIRNVNRPCIVAGDFNALSGAYEMRLFLGATGLISANTAHLPTYPSWNPRRELDYICYSRELGLKRFFIPQVELSDHLPLVCDFSI